MPAKADKTKQLIVQTATGLFSQKGYTAVTMKDICEACNLSRGGLYRYYGSTKEIFIEVLEKDSNDAEESLDLAIASGLSASKLLSTFFALQKNDILYRKNRIEAAVYDFCIAHPDQKDYLNERFNVAVRTFEKLIDYGQKKNEFKAGSPVDYAKHIVIFLEGLKLSSTTIQMTEELLTQQFQILYEMMVK